MEINDEEIKKFNGYCVIRALISLKQAATEDELMKCFATANDESKIIILNEIKRILDNGVMNGFIVNNANKYSLPYLQNEYEVDGERSYYSEPDLEYVSPRHPRYEVFSSTEALAEGAPHKDMRDMTDERKRRYTKRRAESTDREPDLDVEYVSPRHPRYEVFSSTEALAEGAPYKDMRDMTAKRKRKYTKRRPEPTDRETRKGTRLRKVAGSIRTEAETRKREDEKLRMAERKRPRAAKRKFEEPSEDIEEMPVKRTKRAAAAKKLTDVKSEHKRAGTGKTRGRGRGRGR